MIVYDGVEPTLQPAWASECPGRLKAELDHLSFNSVGPVLVDDDLLKAGVLRVEFTWALPDGTRYALDATYPEGFPRLRPHVKLRQNPEKYDDRHIGPNGELCLLGRDSRYWQANTTLADLLYTNFENAITASGVEDPQGEPAEVWWNGMALDMGTENYLLVDSAWNLTEATGGVADLIYTFSIEGRRPRFWGVVDKIWGDEDRKTLLGERTFPLPPRLNKSNRTTITWGRRDDLPKPTGNEPLQIAKALDLNGRYEPVPLGRIRVSLLVQKSELAHDLEGDCYICGLAISLGSGKKSRSADVFPVPVYRAGEMDIGHRIPSMAPFRKSRVAIFGLGALGSPLAIELARNGIGHLDLVDFDVVEPGNIVRWALGASAWGVRKPDALSAYIGSEYATTSVRAVHANIGRPASQAVQRQVLEEVISGADLVIDATASVGVTFHLSDLCRKLDRQLVSLAATPNLKGGTVGFYQPKAACPVCREFAYDDGIIEPAPGASDIDLTQPPGCGENTFTGASFDLQEITLQAARLTSDILSGAAPARSEIHTLSLHDGTRRMPPAWRVQVLPISSRCSCT